MPAPVTSSAVDIASRGDVHDLVVGFYREIVFDDLLAPVFGEVAEVDWTVHIPRLIDYWCRTLLGEPGYRGAILAAHRHVHDLDALRLEHFDRWYELWARSIDATWQGPVAENAKRHAERVGASLTRQLLDLDWRPRAPVPGPQTERIRP
jgi:hemoglobin